MTYRGAVAIAINNIVKDVKKSNIKNKKIVLNNLVEDLLDESYRLDKEQGLRAEDKTWKFCKYACEYMITNIMKANGNEDKIDIIKNISKIILKFFIKCVTKCFTKYS